MKVKQNARQENIEIRPTNASSSSVRTSDMDQHMIGAYFYFVKYLSSYKGSGEFDRGAGGDGPFLCGQAWAPISCYLHDLVTPSEINEHHGILHFT